MLIPVPASRIPTLSRANLQPEGSQAGTARGALLARLPQCGASLRAYPQVLGALEARDTCLGQEPGESAEQYQERLATALMALFRDTHQPRAYEALYRLAFPSVLTWIERMVKSMRSKVDPREVLQDTFVNVYRYSARFRADRPASFRVWVRTIGANLVKRSLQRSERLHWQSLPEGLQEPTDTALSPAGSALAREEMVELQRSWHLFLVFYLQAFQTLSDRDRRALELVDVEGNSYAETGEILGVGPSNMKMIMFRARRRLLAALRKELPEVTGEMVKAAAKQSAGLRSRAKAATKTELAQATSAA